jgi:hypothetical protein
MGGHRKKPRIDQENLENGENSVENLNLNLRHLQTSKQSNRPITRYMRKRTGDVLKDLGNQLNADDSEIPTKRVRQDKSKSKV